MHCKLELFVNGEPLDTADDRKLLSQIPIRDKMVEMIIFVFLPFHCFVLANIGESDASKFEYGVVAG